jgi:creatinine amidohydrolase/Fe(II)-dependent formamide hydrolase-like protein
MPFTGTIAIKVDTLKNLIIDVCESLITHGVNKILLVDCHGSPEQQGCCYNAAYYLQQKYGTTIGVYNGHINLDNAQKILAERENNPQIIEVGHAGAGETALILASRKGKKHVIMDNAVKVESKLAEKIEEENYIARKGGYKLSPTGLKIPAPGPLEFSPIHGHIGDPTKASAEIGNKLYNILAKDMARLVKRIVDIANIPSGKRDK